MHSIAVYNVRKLKTNALELLKNSKDTYIGAEAYKKEINLYEYCHTS